MNATKNTPRISPGTYLNGLGEVLLIRTMVEIEQAILGMSQITGFRVNCYSIGCNSIDDHLSAK